MIRNKFKTDLVAVALVIAGLLSSCNHRSVEQKAVKEPVKTGIKLSNAQIQLANIKVEQVTESAIGHQLLLSSVLKVDEQSTISVSAGIPGRIQKLLFKNTGEIVNKGDALYDFYSEDLMAIIREYITLENNNYNFSGRFDRSLALKDKMLLLGLLPSQINDLPKNKYTPSITTIYAKTRGIVRSIDITEGEYVSTGQRLMELADDSKMWVEAQVYPNEMQLIKSGMPVDVIFPNSGDLRIRSTIDFINPALEPGSNVTLVRAIINNPMNKLYPGMLALLRVETQKSKGIVVPASALLINKQGTEVWLQQNDGSFINKIVTTGIQTADSVLILSGLNQYDNIVTTGAYLLNSEMILKKSADPEAKKAL